ncbi:MAG: zinc-ribbon domain-containing protein [Acidobacteria bacterium]|nr:zinc-ribbon domain-containing protein [Acidobacteriota bacterium]MCA1627230.1 zinc-ribbon domain-containing protein [Acidobacteriota bacterium]
MIIVCPKCSTRLQVDQEKSPNRPFNVRCPKCSATISSGGASPALEQSALAVGGSPATDHPRFEQNTARAYESPTKPGQSVEAGSSNEALRMLADLLSQGTARDAQKPGSRPAWDKRKALVCSSEPYREAVARKLTDIGFQVYVAEDTRQAIETMRSNQMDAVLLDPQFDPTEQGSAFVVREVNVLRPAQRRRLFFVLLSPSLRTMDAHAAFLNNANAIINVNDLDDLDRVMDVALRDFNELYREFFSAFGLTAL